MKLFLFASLSIVAYTAAAQEKGGKTSRAEVVLQKMYESLQGLRTLKYTQVRELNYASEHYQNTSTWNVYVDFRTPDSALGFRYQVETPAAKQVFNGTEKFELDNASKTIRLTENPKMAVFNTLSVFYNSPVTLKNILPVVLADTSIRKSVRDTVINGRTHAVVTVNTGKRRVQNLGTGFDGMKTPTDFLYTILVRTDSFLPVAIVQRNEEKTDFIQTSFADADPASPAPPPASWYYSTYEGDFKRATDETKTSIIQKGAAAPDWTLGLFNENKTLSLRQLRGKLTLIEFWIKNCNYCIQSVGLLNELQQQFKNKGLRVVGINAYDAKEDVAWFCEKHNVRYPVLLNGKSVAALYGATGYPVFVLVDKKGEVVYATEGLGPSTRATLAQRIKEAQ